MNRCKKSDYKIDDDEGKMLNNDFISALCFLPIPSLLPPLITEHQTSSIFYSAQMQMVHLFTVHICPFLPLMENMSLVNIFSNAMTSKAKDKRHFKEKGKS